MQRRHAGQGAELEHTPQSQDRAGQGHDQPEDAPASRELDSEGPVLSEVEGLIDGPGYHPERHIQSPGSDGQRPAPPQFPSRLRPLPIRPQVGHSPQEGYGEVDTPKSEIFHLIALVPPYHHSHHPQMAVHICQYSREPRMIGHIYPG